MLSQVMGPALRSVESCMGSVWAEQAAVKARPLAIIALRSMPTTNDLAT